ncbi:MAG: xanthine dehydrogenase family protein [Enhydrobacter sp.]|nr:MAG: xanthine dehydrogenase family protein [Enhydrobacter sp.]
MPRRETRRLVTGGGRFVDDHAAKGELHAAFLRSPYPHAAFAFGDLAAARGLAGVAAVLTAADLDRVCRAWRCESKAFPGLVSPEQRPLARDEALHQGEPVALVLATSRAVAEDALELIDIDWRELPSATDLATALAADAPPVQRGLGSNLAWSTEWHTGDVDKAFADAALVVEETFTFERHTGVTLESRGAFARWDRAAGTLEVRLSHQMPHQMQLHLAQFLDLPMSRVRVICGDVGGGFGVKMHVYPDEIAVCAASRLLGRPVRFQADRLESFVSDIHAREHIVRARMAVDAEGRIVAMDVDDLQGLGAYSIFPRSSTAEAMSGLRVMGAPYRFADFRAKLRCALQNKVSTGQFRAVGAPIAVSVTERLVDLAARARGEDPLDFRRRNLMRPEDMPCTAAAGSHLFGLSHHQCLEKLVELMDLPSLCAEIAEGRRAGRLLGLGFASAVEMTASGVESYGRAGVPVASIDSVTATLELSGEVTAKASVSEIGQGVVQGLAQIMADAVGVPVSMVTVESGDTATVPHGGGAWASRGAAIGGEAAWGAGVALRAEILGAAAALLQVTVDALDLRDGEVVDRESGARRMSAGEIAHLVTFRGFELPKGLQPRLGVTHTYRREQHVFLPNNGIQASLVEIDRATGLVRVLRHWAVDDCGRIVNPLLVDEQIRGGVVMGLGEALLEACRYDAAGQQINATLADYRVPMAAEMPDIAVAHVETPYAGSVVGAKGAGEAGTCAAPAAVLNAVNDALAGAGGRIAHLPIDPLQVLRALGELDEETAP